MIGEEDIVSEHPLHQTTLTCVSQVGEVFVLSKEDFNLRVRNQTENNLELKMSALYKDLKMMERIDTKMDIHKEKLKTQEKLHKNI